MKNVTRSTLLYTPNKFTQSKTSHFLNKKKRPKMLTIIHKSLHKKLKMEHEYEPYSTIYLRISIKATFYFIQGMSCADNETRFLFSTFSSFNIIAIIICIELKFNNTVFNRKP